VYFYLDGSCLIHMVDQTLSMFIRMKGCAQQTDSYEHQNMVVFGQICALFKNLKYLNFCSTSNYEQLTVDVIHCRSMNFHQIYQSCTWWLIVWLIVCTYLIVISINFKYYLLRFVTLNMIHIHKIE
jgi:hypothetical protein